MKESFSELYARLYNENFEELEAEYTAFINKTAKEQMGQYNHHWGMRQNLQGLMTLTKCSGFAGSGAIDFGDYAINSQIEGLIEGGRHACEYEEGKEKLLENIKDENIKFTLLIIHMFKLWKDLNNIQGFPEFDNDNPKETICHIKSFLSGLNQN